MSSNFLNDENKGDIIIYQSESGETKIDVRFQDETVWLTQAQMEELFQSSHANVVEHIKNIYSEGELDESSTCRKFRQVRREGNRNVERERLYYNLDMIISLGYRIRSSIATQFRRWATERLKEYMIKGFAMSPTPKMQTYSGHVAYVRDSPGSTTTYRKKIRAYRLTALYHALLTIGPYYPAAGLAP